LTGYFSRLSRDKQNNNPENPVDPVQIFLNKIMILDLIFMKGFQSQLKT